MHKALTWGGQTVSEQASDNSNSITIYVNASEAPYLYVWEGEGADKKEPNGGWPGTQMSETQTKEVKGTMFFYQTISSSTGSINIIFNRGQGKPQTDNIVNITSDSYFKYDGNKAADNVTAQYKDPEMPDAPDVLPSYKKGEICAFFEVPASVTAYENVFAYAWTPGSPKAIEFTNAWPGDQCAEEATLANGNKVWKWTYNGTLADKPVNIIFNKGSNEMQTGDMGFVNGGYYKTTTGTLNEDCTTGKVAELEGESEDILTRDFTANQYATIYLPYAVSAEELAQLKGDFYEYTSEADGVLTFTGVKELKAWTPYVYIASENGKNLAPLSGKVVVENVSTEVKKGNFTFKGTNTRKNLITNKQETYYGYRATDGTFVKVGSTKGANIDAWKAYFITSTAGGAEAKSSSFVGGETTGINHVKQILENAADDAVYTIDGKRMGTQNLPKGLYIYKGKKLIVK